MYQKKNILSIEKRFSIYLNDTVLPTLEQKQEELWDVSGILKKNSNQHFKFDVRGMFNMHDNQLGKKISTKSKADKIVFETENQWIVIDFNEFNDYVKKTNLFVFQFEDLLNNLEWNIIIQKAI
jgi:hypothetical protein